MRACCYYTALLSATAVIALFGGVATGDAPGVVRVDRCGDPLPPGALARLGTLRFLHNSPVYDLKFLPDGRTILSSCSDGRIHFWGAATGREVRRLGNAQSGGSYSYEALVLTVSADGRTLATTGHSLHGIQLWSLESGEARTLAKGEVGPFFAALSPDGSWLAAKTRFGVIRLWDAASGKELRTFPNQQNTIGAPAYGMTFSPDGKSFAASDDSHQVYVWDVETGRLIHRFKSYDRNLSTFAFLPDGRRLVSVGWDKWVRLWDIATGREVQRLGSLDGNVRGLVVHPDGRMIITTSDDNTVRVWDLQTGREQRRFSARSFNSLPIALSPDGSILAIGSDDNRIRLWELATGRELTPFRSVPTGFSSVHVTFDPRRLLSQGSQGELHRWDSQTGEHIGRFQNDGRQVGTACLSADGKLLATCSVHRDKDPDTRVQVWDLPSGRLLNQLQPPVEMVGLALSPTGKLLAASGWDNKLRFWELPTGREVSPLREELEKKEGLTPWITRHLGFSPDGRYLITEREAMGGAGTGAHPRLPSEMLFWDLATGKRLPQLGGDFTERCYWAVFSPDSKIMASNDLWTYPGFQLTEVATGRTLHRPGGRDYVHTAAFSLTGKMVATGLSNGDIEFWSPRSGQSIGRLKGHTGAVHSLTFSVDGALLISSSVDGTALIWDMAALAAAQRPTK
jgi:WD40 repeat protein